MTSNQKHEKTTKIDSTTYSYKIQGNYMEAELPSAV